MKNNLLNGVPHVHYGAFGSCTPFPICVKACTDYMGEAISLADISCLSGGAFRLAWNLAEWDGGNVDIMYTYDQPGEVFKRGIEGLGYTYASLWRHEGAGKDAFKQFIARAIDDGVPVIALGVIGPPEACVVVGYQNDGDTLVCSNFFQGHPEFSGATRIDADGYGVTDAWWENENTFAVMTMWRPRKLQMSAQAVLRQAIDVMRPHTDGMHAKGLSAFDAWHKAILDDTQFPEHAVLPLLAERLMCHGDAMDCLADGRHRAAEYIASIQAEFPAHEAALEKARAAFDRVCGAVRGMSALLSGWQRDERAMRALVQKDVRVQTGALILEARAADEEALEALSGVV